jgi:hypothetical protein
MAIDLERFVEIRPLMFHLTASNNLPRIRSLRQLESAAILLARAGLHDEMTRRRPENQIITVDDIEVCLRDQTPLHERNVEFAEGWDFSQVVALLNQRVFFWPGSNMRHGPNDHGFRFYERYEHEDLAVLRVPTRDLLKSNSDNPPEFCRYNSGSPRCSRGRGSPRGSDTFLTASCCNFLEREAVEVAFVGKAVLPDSTSIRRFSWTSWDPLFGNEACLEMAVAEAFPESEREAALEALARYTGSEPTRVRLRIVALARGNLDAVMTYVKQANEDYRDILS